MPDRGLFWSPVPDWSRADILCRDLNVTTRSPTAAWLVSGNLAKFLEERERLSCRGPREVCDPNTYALRLAPDRMLFVSLGAASAGLPVFGWSDNGIAVTDVSDGFVLFDVAGRAALGLMKLGANYEFEAAPAGAAESALMVFAGLKVAVARLEHGWRLHVERPYATALWQWLQHAASEWDKPPAA
jgi:heterotetrameric sarcosine oxidase gamma subunit